MGEGGGLPAVGEETLKALPDTPEERDFGGERRGKAG